MATTLSFANIKPFIRFAQTLRVNERSNFHDCTAYDNRFFYCAEGEGTITIEGKDYPISKGCAVLWRAGLCYDLRADKGQEMCLLGCNFDFTQEHSFLTAPIPPAFKEFEPESIIERVSFGDTPCLNSVVYLENMHLLESNISLICKEYTRHVSLYREKISAIFTVLLTDMVRENMLAGDTSRRSSTKVQEILAYIVEHHYEPLTNASLGVRFGYHPNYINHLVVQHTGMSLHRYLLSCRINRAIDLLQSTDLSVSEISDMTGFTDYNHFLKYFKKTTGHTTKAFRGK